MATIESTEVRSAGMLKPNEVAEIYRQLELAKGGEIRSDVLTMIGHYPNWWEEYWLQSRVGELEIFNDGGDLGVILTDRGRSSKVSEVAKRYEKNQEKILGKHPDFYVCIEKGVVGIRRGDRPVAPIIIVPGRKYPHAPDSDFIDGTKRSIAAAVFSLRTGKDPQIRVLRGQKASLLERAATRLGLNRFSADNSGFMQSVK